jgi:hypothetical protein
MEVGMAKRVQWKAEVGDLAVTPVPIEHLTYRNGVKVTLNYVEAGTVGIVTERVRRKREGCWWNLYTVQYGTYADIEVMECSLTLFEKG